jgi:hypothetical protein
MNTSGFYKNEDGLLLSGPNFVLSGSYNLYREEKHTYTYPIGGWYWFDSIEEACAFFEIEIPEWHLNRLEE